MFEQVAAGFELREFGADALGEREALGDVEAVERLEFIEAGEAVGEGQGFR